MLKVGTFERQLFAVLDALAAAAVAELGGLLERRCAAAAAPRSAEPGAGSPEEGGAGRPELKQPSTETLTNQCAVIMETLTKRAAENILSLLKTSTCEAEANLKPTAERETRGRTYDVTRQKESICGSHCEPTHLLTESTAETASDVSQEDDIQDHTDASATTSRIRRKQTESFRCPSCDKAFPMKCLMERHQRTHSKPHLCTECGKRFADPQRLVAHSRRHTGDKPYKCLDCGTEFAYKYTLTRHMRQHGLRRQSTHTCPLCERQFAGPLALQRHRCCALETTFVCSICAETFDCRQTLSHHENLHSGERGFVCETCGESFFSVSSLAVHRVTHTQVETCCDALGLGCSDMSVLRNHLSKHTGEKLFACEVCGKGCSHRSALKHHMLTHTDERPYVCETCGKRCGHASALQNHMRIHTGRKPGQQPLCDMCGKKFRCMVNLKYHMSVHTGEKPYACDLCDKKFSNPSNLRLHTVTHSGEKLYGCNICGRRFTQAGSLKLHRRIHTGERPHRCPVCGKEFTHNSNLKKHQRSHETHNGNNQTSAD